MYKVALEVNRRTHGGADGGSSSGILGSGAPLPRECATTEITIPIDTSKCYFPVDERQRLVKAMETKQKARRQAVEGREQRVTREPKPFNPVLHARQEVQKARAAAQMAAGKEMHGHCSLDACLRRIKQGADQKCEEGAKSASLDGSPLSARNVAGVDSPTTGHGQQQNTPQRVQSKAPPPAESPRDSLQQKVNHGRHIRKAIAASIDALRSASRDDAVAHKKYCAKIVADRNKAREQERIAADKERRAQRLLINPPSCGSSSSFLSDLEDVSSQRSSGSQEGGHTVKFLGSRTRPPKIKRRHPAAEGTTDKKVRKARMRREYELTQTVMDPLPSSFIPRPPQGVIDAHDQESVRLQIQRIEAELEDIRYHETYTAPYLRQQQNARMSSSNACFSATLAVVQIANTLKTNFNKTTNSLNGTTTSSSKGGVNSPFISKGPLAPRTPTPDATTKTAPPPPTRKEQLMASLRLLNEALATGTRSKAPRRQTATCASSSSMTITPHREQHQNELMLRVGDSVHLRRWLTLIFVANSMMSLTAPVVRQRLCFIPKISRVPLSLREVTEGIQLKFRRSISPRTYDVEMRRKEKENARREHKRKEAARLLQEKAQSPHASFFGLQMGLLRGSSVNNSPLRDSSPLSASFSSSSSNERGSTAESDVFDSTALGTGLVLGDLLSHDPLTATPSPPARDTQNKANRKLIVTVGGIEVSLSSFKCPSAVEFTMVQGVPMQCTTVFTTRHSLSDQETAELRTGASQPRVDATEPWEDVLRRCAHNPSSPTNRARGSGDSDAGVSVNQAGYQALLPYYNFSSTFEEEQRRARASLVLDKCALRISVQIRIFKKRRAVQAIIQFLRERKGILDMRDNGDKFKQSVVRAQRAIRRRKECSRVVVEHWKAMWRQWEVTLAGRAQAASSSDDDAGLAKSVSRPTTSHLSTAVVPKPQVLRRRRPRRVTLADALETPGLKPWFMDNLQAISSYKYDLPVVQTTTNAEGDAVLSEGLDEERLDKFMWDVHTSVAHQRTVQRRRRAQFIHQQQSTAVTVDGDAKRANEEESRIMAIVNKQVPIRAVGPNDILGLLVYSVLNGGGLQQQHQRQTGLLVSAPPHDESAKPIGETGKRHSTLRGSLLRRPSRSVCGMNRSRPGSAHSQQDNNNTVGRPSIAHLASSARSRSGGLDQASPHKSTSRQQPLRPAPPPQQHSVDKRLSVRRGSVMFVGH